MTSKPKKPATSGISDWLRGYVWEISAGNKTAVDLLMERVADEIDWLAARVKELEKERNEAMKRIPAGTGGPFGGKRQPLLDDMTPKPKKPVPKKPKKPKSKPKGLTGRAKRDKGLKYRD